MQTTWKEKPTDYYRPWVERIVCWQLVHNDIILDIGYFVAYNADCFTEKHY